MVLNRFFGVTPMDMHEHFSPSKQMPVRAAAPTPYSSFGVLQARLAAWVKKGAAAAGAYEDLSHLSDTQLKDRELSRDIIARDLSDCRDRGFRGARGEVDFDNMAGPEMVAARTEAWP
jgi:hypothetical protein